MCQGGGAHAPPDFGRSEGAAGSAGLPHYCVPPRFLDFDTCLRMTAAIILQGRRNPWAKGALSEKGEG